MKIKNKWGGQLCLKGIMSVKNKPIETCNSDEIYSDLNNGYVQKELLLPKKSKETHKIEGSTDDIVVNIIDVLKNKIKVI